jgi:1,4-dihydroxy-2-naphthoate octaprenyltransferase
MDYGEFPGYQKMKSNKPGALAIWISASRPRTLTLAVSSIGMGTLLAAITTKLNGSIIFMTLLTAVLLQVLSNLANDYGDSEHGADHAGRSGPLRAVQSGHVSTRSMQKAILLLAILTLLSGFILLWLALGTAGLLILLAFASLGLLAIWAAISYTSGGLAYGYVGLGDLAVFLFFGWLGVLGSYYLQTGNLTTILLLPATSVGLFTVGVLNVNNIRDIESDRLAGKQSIPVRLGLGRARVYHWLLIVGGLLATGLYVVAEYQSPWQLLFIFSVPLFVRNGLAVSRRPPVKLDPYLKELSLSTMFFVLTFGIGQLIGLTI